MHQPLARSLDVRNTETVFSTVTNANSNMVEIHLVFMFRLTSQIVTEIVLKHKHLVLFKKLCIIFDNIYRFIIVNLHTFR